MVERIVKRCTAVIVTVEETLKTVRKLTQTV